MEIAKALSKEVKLLILDEPTASLNESDSDALLALLKEFRSHGISAILISHKLNEILKVADTITILRDGATVDRLDCHAQKVDEDRIIRSMVGRELADRYPKRHPKIGEPIFEVKNWVVYHKEHADRQMIKGIDLNVRRGEIVGIAGLMGSGRTELAMSIFGRSYGQKISGQVLLHGKEIDVSTIDKAMKSGIAYVTEDRKNYGLVLIDDIKRNITLANLAGVSRNGVIDDGQEQTVAHKYRRDLNIRCSSVFQQTVNLSGGNQQKVVLSKWLFTGPEILILDEPTRGIDVGAKFEIYTIIARLAEEGKGIIVISSEMPELLGISDRIYVMNEGRIVGEMPTREAEPGKDHARDHEILGQVRLQEVVDDGTADLSSGRAGPAPQPGQLREEQHPRIRHAAVADPDHGVLPVHDQRHAAEAAQPHQPHPAEQLHRHHGARHDADHRGRAISTCRSGRCAASSARSRPC